ncbi:MAG: hypothetical protein ACFFAY_07045 [Promethearchaeota archaeon]
MSPQSQLDLPGTQSSIPLFSGAFYEGYYIAGFAWGIVLQLILYIIHITIDIFQWLIMTIVAGLFAHFFVLVMKKRRFYNPVSNQAITALFEDVKRDLGSGEGIELWYRTIDRGVFLSTSNLLFKAILLSESTIADVLEKEDKGRILLAREVLLIERLSPLSRLAIALLAFVLSSFFESMSFGGALTYISFSLAPNVLAVGIIGVLMAAASISYIQSKSVNKIDQLLEDSYGQPPAAAMIEVLTGFRISEEMIEEAKREEEETPSRSRAALKQGMVGALVAFFVAFSVMFFLFSRYRLFMTFAVVISAIVGFGAFVIIFMTSSMWFLIKPTGSRSTEYDIQVPFAADVQGFLNQFLDDERTAVIATKLPFHEEYGFVIARLQDNYQEKTLFSLMPQILKDINDVELAGSLILSEIWRKDIEKRYNRFSYASVGAAIIFLISSISISLMLFGFEEFFAIFLPILGLYTIVAIIPSTLAAYWKRTAEIRSDVRVAKACPRFIEALQILTDKHHTLPFGTTSYQTRLERIDKVLEPVREYRYKNSRNGFD